MSEGKLEEMVDMNWISPKRAEDSLAHKSENVYNLSDILIRDHDVRTYFTDPHGRGKILHFAGSGHRSCGEATCYPEILRIPYNFVQDIICIGQIMKTCF